MTKSYDSALLARLEEYLLSGHSQEETAKRIGVSAGLLSAYRKKTYSGNIKNAEDKLREMFALIDAKSGKAIQEAPLASEAYVNTSISEKVYNTIRYGHLKKGIVLAVGDAGVGKTSGAKKYNRDHPNTSVYIAINPISGSPRNFLIKLAQIMGLPSGHNSLKLSESIQEKLEAMNCILIIDESQHLKYQTIEVIRNWADCDLFSENKGIGIALVGNERINTQMTGRRELEFDQQYSRKRFLLDCRREDVILEDIQKLFPALGAREQTFLLSIGKSKIGLRGVSNVYDNALEHENTGYEGLLISARNLKIGLI